MDELNKLEAYLKEHGYIYERIDEDLTPPLNRRQIIVYDDEGYKLWDVICHYGSYGYPEGLLELMYDRLPEEVQGHLTAEEVIAIVTE